MGEDSASSYGRNDEEDEFDNSHDQNSEMSFNQPSVARGKPGSGPDWSKIYNEGNPTDVYEDD